MVIKQFDTVRLKYGLPDEGIPPGTLATVLDVYEQPTSGYEIEVVDDEGRTIFWGSARRSWMVWAAGTARNIQDLRRRAGRAGVVGLAFEQAARRLGMSAVASCPSNCGSKTGAESAARVTGTDP